MAVLGEASQGDKVAVPESTINLCRLAKSKQ